MEDEREDKRVGIVTKESHSTSAFSKRRKILTGAPALLLLANRPAFAGTCSISGFMSAKVGTSLTTHDGNLCDGWSPGNWKNDRGQITSEAWDVAGVSSGDGFKILFNTTNMSTSGNGHIRKVINGTPDAFISYESGIGYSMLSVLQGAVTGGNNASSIVKHAAATYLNAAFLANGGGGSAPDPWMVNYISPTDVIGLYLLYELTFLSSALPAGVTYRYERGGSVIAESQNMTTTEYKNFFEGLSNGSGSQTWQDG